MSGENINVYGTFKALESNGATFASGTIVKATSAYDLTADGAFYPDAVFALTCTFATAPTENAVITLCARPLLIDGTNSTEVPETTRPTRQIGNFVVNNVTTLQAMELVCYDLPKNAEYYLFNNATGQSVSTGWTLRVTPRTVKAAP